MNSYDINNPLLYKFSPIPRELGTSNGKTYQIVEGLITSSGIYYLAYRPGDIQLLTELEFKNKFNIE